MMPDLKITLGLGKMIEKVPEAELGNLIAMLQILATEPKDRTLEEYGIVSVLDGIVKQSYRNKDKPLPAEFRR